MKWTFDYKPTDVFWCTADVGWVTGHSYICYGPLAVGATEIACGLALFVPRARLWACGVLLAVMAGAAATHLLHGEPRRAILNVALSALLGLLIRVGR